MIQEILTYLIISFAASYTVYHAVKMVFPGKKGNKSACSGGCSGSCTMKHSKVIKTINIR